MILRPVRPVSPIGPPMTKRPVGLMWYLVCSSSHLPRQNRLDDVLQDVGVQLVVGNRLGVLAGDDDGVDARRLAVLVVLHRDLALAVGAQIGQLAVLAHVVSCRVSLWAREIAAGISSGVSLTA